MNEYIYDLALVFAVMFAGLLGVVDLAGAACLFGLI